MLLYGEGFSYKILSSARAGRQKTAIAKTLKPTYLRRLIVDIPSLSGNDLKIAKTIRGARFHRAKHVENVLHGHCPTIVLFVVQTTAKPRPRFSTTRADKTTLPSANSEARPIRWTGDSAVAMGNQHLLEQADQRFQPVEGLARGGQLAGSADAFDLRRGLQGRG